MKVAPRRVPAAAAAKLKPKPVEGLVFYEVPGATGPLADIDKKLAAFYAKYPLRRLRKSERRIVESLRAVSWQS